MTANRPAKNHPWRCSRRRWIHNVQLIRLSFPPYLDEAHHEALIAFDKALKKLISDHDLPYDPSYLGFYRGNADWDNIDTPNACVCGPDRGARTEELDNEP